MNFIIIEFHKSDLPLMLIEFELELTYVVDFILVVVC